MDVDTAKAITKTILTQEGFDSLWQMVKKSAAEFDVEGSAQAVVAATMMAGPNGASATAALSGAQVVRKSRTYQGLLHLAQACHFLRPLDGASPAVGTMVADAITELTAMLIGPGVIDEEDSTEGQTVPEEA